MDPLAGMDDSSTDDDAASQTTEDDPQVPENQEAAAPPPPLQPTPSTAPVPAPRDKPSYELRHTLRGHSQSISAVKFSPDGTLLASCGAPYLVHLTRPSLINFIFLLYLVLEYSSGRQCGQDMVSFYGRTDSKPKWAYDGTLRHSLVFGQCIPCFCIR